MMPSSQPADLSVDRAILRLWFLAIEEANPKASFDCFYVGFQTAMQAARYEPAFLAEMARVLRNQTNPLNEALAGAFRQHVELCLSGAME